MLFAVAGVSGLAAGYFLQELQGSGFPDGYRSALDRFHETAYPLFAAALTLLALGALGLGVRWANAAARRKAKAVVLAAGALGLACLAIDFYAAGFFEHGGGG